MKKDVKKFIESNKDNVIIGIISLIVFIIGCLSVNPVIAFLIIILLDSALFVPNLLKTRKTAEKGRHTALSRKKYYTKATKVKDKPKTKKPTNKKKKILKMLIRIFLSCCILFIVLGCIAWAIIVVKAPKFDPKELYHQEATTLYDKDGEAFATLGSENREIISYDDLPEVLINAIIATEDSRFYQHNGFDLPRFTKATLQTMLGSSSAGGASTLTMQLVKNHYTSTERSITRKFTDIYIATNKIEKKYTKEEILEFYVNAPYLGGSSYGVEQACKTYFGKSAKDINLAEAAMIAGLFQSPGSDDPTRYPEKAEKRRQIVLKLMKKHGYINEEEYKAASKITIKQLLVDKDEESEGVNEYQGFVDTVIEEMQKDGLDPYSNSFKVYTTMDRKRQDYINDIMNGKKWDWKDKKVTAGIAVIDVKNGELAAVGAGRDKSNARTFNTATQLKNQIGSTAKPLYDYSVGIEYENWSTYEPMTDENISYSDGTELNNWDGSYMGFLTLRNALAQSRNTSAVKAFKKNNNENIRKSVTAMGLHPEETVHQAHAIGGYTGEYPVATAAAYATFANGGVWNSPHSYTKIINKNTDEEIKKEVKTNKVFSPQTAYIMTDLLQSSAKVGLGGYSNINGCVYGAKTGTSNFDTKTLKARGMPSSSINDYWVSGISPDYAVSVWYGYEKPNKKYHNSFGTTYHERLFQLVGKGIFKKGSSFKNPGGVKKVTVESETYPAKLPSAYTPGHLKVTELFKAGTEPTETSDRFAQLSDVKNLRSSLSGNELTLSWEGISTPSALDSSKIAKLAKDLFETGGFQKSFIGKRNSYNNKNIGTVVYRIYGKNSDGSLTEINSTSDTSITFTINTSSPTTYVVKTSYSIFKANMANGVSTTISLDGVTDILHLELIGDSSITTPKGTYEEDGIRILKNGTEVKESYTTKYTNNNGTPTTKEGMNSTPGSYTVIYSYGGKDVTRSVVIQ